MRELAQKLQQDRPDLKLTETMDFATPAQEEFDRTMHTLYEGAALAEIGRATQIGRASCRERV